MRAANGEVVRELRAIINSDDRIDNKAAQRLQMAALVGIYENVEVLRTENADNARTLEKVVVQVAESVETVKKISSNPMVQFGEFLGAHPKLALFFLIVFFLIANLWFVPSFRAGILVWLGAPQELITLFTEIPTAIP